MECMLILTKHTLLDRLQNLVGSLLKRPILVWKKPLKYVSRAPCTEMLEMLLASTSNRMGKPLHNIGFL